MFALDLKDPGRFFALWDFLKSEERQCVVTKTAGMLQLALNTAIESQSATRTIGVLREMFEAKVYPSPQAAGRLAAVAREVPEVHELMRNLVALQQHEVYRHSRREQQLLQTRLDEHELRVYRQGKPNIRSNETEEQRARRMHFEKKDKADKHKWLPLGEFIQSKQKGGEVYAQRHDRPTPSLVEP